MSKYDRFIKRAVKQLPNPVRGVVVDFVQLPNQIEIRVYENQVMALSEGQQTQLLAHLFQLKELIESFGANVILGGVAGDPPRK